MKHVPKWSAGCHLLINIIIFVPFSNKIINLNRNLFYGENQNIIFYYVTGTRNMYNNLKITKWTDLYIYFSE